MTPEECAAMIVASAVRAARAGVSVEELVPFIRTAAELVARDELVPLEQLEEQMAALVDRMLADPYTMIIG